MHEELLFIGCMCCGHRHVDPEAGICGNCGNEDASKMVKTYCWVRDEEDD